MSTSQFVAVHPEPEKHLSEDRRMDGGGRLPIWAQIGFLAALLFFSVGLLSTRRSDLDELHGFPGEMSAPPIQQRDDPAMRPQGPEWRG